MTTHFTYEIPVCGRYCSSHFVYIISFNLTTLQEIQSQVYLLLFYSWRGCILEKLSLGEVKSFVIQNQKPNFQGYSQIHTLYSYTHIPLVPRYICRRWPEFFIITYHQEISGKVQFYFSLPAIHCLSTPQQVPSFAQRGRDGLQRP